MSGPGGYSDVEPHPVGRRRRGRRALRERHVRRDRPRRRQPSVVHRGADRLHRDRPRARRRHRPVPSLLRRAVRRAADRQAAVGAAGAGRELGTAIRDATTAYADNCIHKKDFDATIDLALGGLSLLNVFTPANATASSALPVMVWVHGGGYQGGGSHEARLNGTGCRFGLRPHRRDGQLPPQHLRLPRERRAPAQGPEEWDGQLRHPGPARGVGVGPAEHRGIRRRSDARAPRRRERRRRERAQPPRATRVVALLLARRDRVGRLHPGARLARLRRVQLLGRSVRRTAALRQLLEPGVPGGAARRRGFQHRGKTSSDVQARAEL